MRFKQALCFIMAILLVFMYAPYVKAQNDYQYGTLEVERSDKKGSVKSLSVMVSDGFLYANAAELSEYMGYEARGKGEEMGLFDMSIYRTMIFCNGKSSVQYTYLTQILEYTMPCPAIWDGDVFWVPLQFTLRMMDCSLNATSYSANNIVTITVNKNVFSTAYYEIATDTSLQFDPVSRLGTSTGQAVAGHIATLLNGVIHLDPASIGQFGAYAFAWAGDYDTDHIYNYEFAEDIGLLFCTNSKGEVQEIGEEIAFLVDVFSDEGDLAEFIDTYKKTYDSDVYNLNEYLQELKKAIDSGSPRNCTFETVSDSLDKMLKKQGIFGDVTAPISELQSNFHLADGTGDLVDGLLLATEWATTADYLENANQSQVEILESFCKNREENGFTSDATVTAFKHLISATKSGEGAATYSFLTTLKDNAYDILDSTNISTKLFGTSGTLIVFAFDIASMVVPFIREGLSSAEQTELSMYASLMEVDAYTQMCNKANDISAAGNNATSEMDKDLIGRAYAYLKFSYISRSAGISTVNSVIEGSFSMSSDEEKMLRDYIKELESENERIEELLALCLSAYSDTDNSRGFSPAKNIEFLNNVNDSTVIPYVDFGNDKQDEDESTGESGFGSLVNDDVYRDIVLVLDTSGSMEGEPFAETVAAAKKFVAQSTGNNTRVGIVEYNSYADQIADFSGDANVLSESIDMLYLQGRTNMYGALSLADSMLENSGAERKIIVLMSDGLPNESPNLVSYWEPYSSYKNELINYSDKLKEKGYYIYTLGFFQNLDYSDLSEARSLLDAIASEGYYYDVDDAESISFFFNDIASAISGTNSILIKIACPVDVTVTYAGETLSSNEDSRNTRTSFGSLSFMGYEDEQKILRLQEGRDYDISIIGTGEGTMNYTISFPDENGDYSDVRTFENIPITPDTVINTNTQSARRTSLKVDTDGNGRVDLKYNASANSFGELAPDYSWAYVSLSVVIIISIAALLLLKFVGVDKIRKAFYTKAQNRQSVVDSYCTYCGAKLLSDGAFCPECGKLNIDNSSPVYVPKKRYCEYCGQPASTNDPFCENCGHRL